jgi:hypothetical protein
MEVTVRRFLQLRNLASLAIVLTSSLPLGASGQAFAQQVTQSVTATATFGPRTSLQVSSQVLQFHITDASIPVEVSVDFAAGARTRIGGDVRLVVDVTDPVEVRPGTTGQALTIVGGTAGTIAGTLAQDAPVVAARWLGSGLRTGRVTFRLHAAPGRYDIPVRFVVTLSDGA